MARFRWRVSRARSVVSDGVMRVNLANRSNTLENNLGSSSCPKTQPTPALPVQASSLRLPGQLRQRFVSTASRATALGLSETHQLSETSKQKEQPHAVAQP